MIEKVLKSAHDLLSMINMCLVNDAYNLTLLDMRKKVMDIIFELECGNNVQE